MKSSISLAGSILYISYPGWEFLIDLEDNVSPFGLNYFCILEQTLAIKRGWA